MCEIKTDIKYVELSNEELSKINGGDDYDSLERDAWTVLLAMFGAFAYDLVKPTSSTLTQDASIFQNLLGHIFDNAI